MNKLIDAEAFARTIMSEPMNEPHYASWWAEVAREFPDAVVRCGVCKKADYDALCGCYWCDGRRMWYDDFCSRGDAK